MRPATEQFAAGERAVAVHVIDHCPQIAHVALVPDARRDPQGNAIAMRSLVEPG